ncbi:ABC transporter ATP-binding protein [Caldinitratiruptor microaerophilus]|uniref:ABC transporter ATP-binding protein n=1 Tax=Caldinitratiruptor microaerophilus TaxID=671077 RepID=A0AA35G5V1_9FIRM|nr:ABC transporter ATP-binding protein [Caldinitratiruptor microaerophilus]BDG60181.1 ABC transporter ATP-binding protein [Caldinitratiruptor microaerophilus]
MLELQGVHTFYGPVEALKGISLTVRKGEIVALLGANGAGKSTTLRTISGLVHPAQGSILFEGQPIHRLPPEAIVRLGISHVPEGRRVFPGLTVKENLLLGASNRGRVPRSELEADVRQMFRIFPDLERLQDALGWTLSGGQQQMLAIARGLMARPKVLLMDEPSLGLAPIIVQQVFHVIQEINASLGTTVLLVEQNASMALRIAHRGYVMETGRIVLEGEAADLLKDPEVREAYLGGRRQAG